MSTYTPDPVVTYCNNCGKPHTLLNPEEHSAHHDDCNGNTYWRAGCWWECLHCKADPATHKLAKYVNWYDA